MTSYHSVTIADGESLSGEADLNEQMLVGIEIPASWTTADITFQVANEDSVDAGSGTFYDLYDSLGNEVTVDAASSRGITLVPADFAGFRYIKVRSGTTGGAVNQSGDITLRLITRPAA